MFFSNLPATAEKVKHLQKAKSIVYSYVTKCILVDINISERLAASIVQVDESVFRSESAGVFLPEG
jgi:hypothetical protein